MNPAYESLTRAMSGQTLNTQRTSGTAEVELKNHVEALCVSPRIPHTEGYFAARKYLAETVRSMGLEPEYHDFFDLPVGPCRNIYVEKGPSEGRRILIGAHYETTPCSGVGADDNASAVAVVLELLRRLPDSLPITAVFFDVEEHFGLGALHGSNRFAKFYKKELQQVYIFDLVGGVTLPGLENSYFQFGNGIARLEDPSLEFLYLPILFLEPLGDLVPRSDYLAFRKRGIPYTFISSGTPWYYHTPHDTPERLSYEKMAHLVGRLIEAIPQNRNLKNTTDWKDFSKFLNCLHRVPGIDPDWVQTLAAKKTPSRWDILKMYKTLLPIIKREKQGLWNRLGKSTRSN